MCRLSTSSFPLRDSSSTLECSARNFYNANIVIYLLVNFRYSKLVSFVLHIREELFGYLIAFYVKTGQ